MKRKIGYYVAVLLAVCAFAAIILTDFYEVQQYLVPALLAFFFSMVAAVNLAPANPTRPE